MNTYFDNLILSDHRLLICSSNCILTTDKTDYQFSLLSINFSPWGGGWMKGRGGNGGWRHLHQISRVTGCLSNLLMCLSNGKNSGRRAKFKVGGGARFGMELENLWHTNVKFYVCYWSICRTPAVSFLVVLSESPKLFALMCFVSTL